MDAGTVAVYRLVIQRYEKFLEGKSVNVIDPNGRTPSKKELKKRLFRMRLAVS